VTSSGQRNQADCNVLGRIEAPEPRADLQSSAAEVTPPAWEVAPVSSRLVDGLGTQIVTEQKTGITAPRTGPQKS
jgi:hypothetical protein